MNDSIFNIAQQSLTPLLGVSKEQLRTLRKNNLAADVDFKNDGNRIWFSQAGVEKLRGLLNLKNAAPETPPEPIALIDSNGNGKSHIRGSELWETTASAPRPVPDTASTAPMTKRVFELPDAPPVPIAAAKLTELQVWRTPVNTRILEAVRVGADLDKNPPVFRVTVRTNVNFTRGMKVPVKHLDGDLFEFAGRLPRWRGKY